MYPDFQFCFIVLHGLCLGLGKSKLYSIADPATEEGSSPRMELIPTQWVQAKRPDPETQPNFPISLLLQNRPRNDPCPPSPCHHHHCWLSSHLDLSHGSSQLSTQRSGEYFQNINHFTFFPAQRFQGLPPLHLEKKCNPLAVVSKV